MNSNPISNPSLGKRPRFTYSNGIFSGNTNEWYKPTRLTGSYDGPYDGPLNMKSNMPHPNIANDHQQHPTDLSITVFMDDIEGNQWPRQNRSGFPLFIRKEDKTIGVHHFFNPPQLNYLLEEGYYMKEMMDIEAVTENGDISSSMSSTERADFHVLPVYSKTKDGQCYIPFAQRFRMMYAWFGSYIGSTTVGNKSENVASVCIRGRTKMKNVISTGYVAGDNLAFICKLIPRKSKGVINERGVEVAAAAEGDEIPQVYGVNLGGNKNPLGNTNRDILEAFDGNNLNFGAISTIKPRECDYEYNETIYIKSNDRKGPKRNPLVLTSLEFGYTQVIGNAFFSRGFTHLSNYIPGFIGGKRLKNASFGLHDAIRNVNVLGSESTEELSVIIF